MKGDTRPLAGVPRMKMRWSVIGPVHVDLYPEELAELGHNRRSNGSSCASMARRVGISLIASAAGAGLCAPCSRNRYALLCICMLTHPAIFETLADPTRRRIVEVLRRG